MKRIFVLLFSVIFVAGSVYAAENIVNKCPAADKIDKERNQFDIQKRKERIAIDEKLLKNEVETIAYDKKLTQLREKMLAAASPKEYDVAVKEFSSIGAKKDFLTEETIQKLRLDKMILSREKFIKLNEYKIKWLSARFACSQDLALKSGRDRKSINEFAEEYFRLKKAIDTSNSKEKALEYRSSDARFYSEELNDQANRQDEYTWKLIDDLNAKLEIFESSSK